MSKQEDFPWIQWKLPSRIRITGVSITTRMDCCGHHFKNVEVRAGLVGINSTFNGKITVNDVCGRVKGEVYAEAGKVHKVECGSTLLSEYITVQIRDKSSTLTINELKYTTKPHSLLGNDIFYVYICFAQRV